MPLAKRLSSKFYVCPRNFASRANVYLSAADIILRHTSHRKRFIYPLPATSAASIHWWGFACSRQKKTCFATYQYLHVCRSLVLRLRAMDFIVSFSKWVNLFIVFETTFLLDNVVRNECPMKIIFKRVWKYTNLWSKWRTKQYIVTVLRILW